MLLLVKLNCAIGSWKFRANLTEVRLDLGFRISPVHSLLRKEVIQPQVPLRLPCYDFIPITSHTFGHCFLAVSNMDFGYNRLS